MKIRLCSATNKTPPRVRNRAGVSQYCGHSWVDSLPLELTSEYAKPDSGGESGRGDKNTHIQADTGQNCLAWRSFGRLVMALALSCAACGRSADVLIAFRTEQQAQEHCPKDTVVWVDPQSGTYYPKASPSYGRGGASRYACRGEAESAGMRQIAN
jgi:hypothetical protein